LFGPEIEVFIDETYKKATKLHARVTVGGPENAEAIGEILEWFSGKIAEAREKFGPYMDFREPKGCHFSAHGRLSQPFQAPSDLGVRLAQLFQSAPPAPRGRARRKRASTR
jgi:hypothetical protein